MNNSDPAERAALISGLRELADYLESTPGVPVSRVTAYSFPATADWPSKLAEVDAVAALLGVAARSTGGGHYVAARYFGPIEYTAAAIPAKSDDESE